MRKKLNSFEILKLESDIIKQKNYTVEINLDEISLSNILSMGEITKIGENTFLEAVQDAFGKRIDFERVQEIGRKIKEISSKKNSNTRRQRIRSLLKERQQLVFVEGAILLKIKNKTHYRHIYKEGGFYVNGRKYVRFLAGAGNIRSEQIFYIWEDIYEEVLNRLHCGAKIEKVNPAKYNAYFGLYGSSGYKVSTPTFAVIPDHIYKRMGTFDYISEDYSIEETSQEVSINSFDGQGLISPYLSEKWGKEIGLEYIPSSFIFRSAFFKGQVVTFDFHKLSEKIGINIGKDIWGNEFHIDEVDAIFSESQLKLWDAYESYEEYVQSLDRWDIPFRITRVSHRQQKPSTTTNYMYLQVLDLDKESIRSICEDTVDYFESIQYGNASSTALYLSGQDAFDRNFGANEFWELDIITKGILSFPDLLREKYFSQRIKSTLQQKMKEAKLGKLIVEGNYSPMVSDPYAQAEWAMGISVSGLLEENDFYSEFWSDRGVGEVAVARSPLTHNSEMQSISLKDGYDLYDWYKYQGTSVIFPYNSLMVYYLADGDL